MGDRQAKHDHHRLLRQHEGGSSAADGGPNSHSWRTTGLARQTTYRVEEQYIRQGTNSWKLHVRIYDSTGTLTKQDSDFVCADHGENLATFMNGSGAINSGTDCLRHKLICNPGASGGRGSSTAAHQHIYYGGFAVSVTDWCGPYTPGE